MATTAARPSRIETATDGPRVVAIDEASGARRDVAVADLGRAVRAGMRIWVDIDIGQPSHARLLSDQFGFHPRAVEAALNQDTRVTVEEFDDYLFFIVRAISFRVATEDDPYDLDTANIAMFLGRDFLVTAHPRPLPVMDDVGEQCERTPRDLQAGSARLAQTIADATVDEFFPLLDQIEEFVDGLEDRVFARFDRQALHDIFQVKRVVLQLRRHLGPEREVVSRLANRPSVFISPEFQLYFRGTYDRILRLNDALETYRELLSSTLEGFFTQISNQLGRVTKALSIFATFSIPFVVISGMWGMNFARVPIADNPNGFWLLVVAQVLLGFGLLGLLRWARLL
jgi:magnesium transporter